MEELLILNPKRRHRRRRRKNEPGPANPRHRKYTVYGRKTKWANPRRHKRHHRRRRNPAFLKGITGGLPIPLIVTGTVGALGSTIIGKYILSLFKAEDKGIMSYVGRLGGGFALAMAGGLLTKKPSVRQGIMVGTGIGVAAKLISDLTSGTSLFGMPSNLGQVRLPTSPSRYGHSTVGPASRFEIPYRKSRWE